jgi:hypothetical protein
VAEERERPLLWVPEGFTQEDFVASLGRLQAAGLIERVVHDMATGDGEISFTPAVLALMQSGRDLFADPGFVAAWLSGDPLAVRAWVETEAGALARGRAGAR